MKKIADDSKPEGFHYEFNYNAKLIIGIGFVLMLAIGSLIYFLEYIDKA
jgi:hypothetical protein